MVLLLAGINYIGLLTARSLIRSKEMHVHKVLGASRLQLFSRLVIESICFCFIAALASLAILSMLLAITPLEIQREIETLQEQVFTSNATLPLFLIATGFGLVTGVYPAWSIARQPIKVTTKNTAASPYGLGIKSRLLLTVIQITLSISVTSCALLMYSQLMFVQSKSFAFDTENTLVIYLRYETVRERLELLTNELSQNPGIIAFTASRDLPAGRERISRASITGGREFPVSIRSVGPNYLSVMGIELIAGSDIDHSVPMTSETRRILVNEAFLVEAQWSAEEAIGKYYGNGQIVGVMEDFVWNPRSPILPTQVIPELYNGNRYLFVKISHERPQEMLDFVASTWRQVIPEYQLEYQFFDDYLSDVLVSELKQSTLVGVAASLCVVLAYIGVTGIVAYITQRRSKELSLRRVFGATFWQLTTMILKNIFPSIGIAAVLALGIYYFSIVQWLRNYSLQTEINLLVFVVATAISLAMTLIVVLLQSRSTSAMNPVENLREE
ncbi:MAG: FtsX-like permease family protein [Pseudohongiellaceae bacterium]